MDLRYIDYVSVSHRSWLHRVPAAVKMIFHLLVIVLLLSTESLAIEAGTAAVLIIIAVSAHLPMRLYLPLVFYPVIFLIILFISIEHLTMMSVFMLGFRVLAITTATVILLLTTSFPEIFGTLGRILPGFLTAALFFTYRSIFIISDSINSIQVVMHLRGGINWRHPISTWKNTGMAMGHFLIDSIDTSERMADGLTIRGFVNRIYYLGGGK